MRLRRVVIDVNSLQSEELRNFLAKRPSNVAVLTDYAGMEVYKADSDEALRESFAIVGQFPQQIQVLKSTSIIGGLSGRSKGLVRRMIDPVQTRQFGEYCQSVSNFFGGDERFRPDVTEKRRLAREHLAAIAVETADLAADYTEISRCFTPHEIRQIRLDEDIAVKIWEKLFWLTGQMASNFFELHPLCTKWPTKKEWPNTFLFRFALLQQLHFMEWIRRGSPKRLNPDKIRNDIVDLNFAAFGTFFDGLMTNDKKQHGLYAEAKLLLDDFIIPASQDST